MPNEQPNQIREQTKSDVDFAVMMMMGTDVDPESTAEERTLQKDLLWVQASTDRTEFLERGRTVKDKWEQVIANDPDYSQGHLPSWQNPWMEFKLAFLSESDNPQDSKEFMSILRPQEHEDPVVTPKDIKKEALFPTNPLTGDTYYHGFETKEETDMPSRDPQMTNEDVLRKPRSEWTHPYEWQHSEILDHQNQQPKFDEQIKNMMSDLSEHPEFRHGGYEWTLKPIYEFSDINQNHRGNGLANSLKDLPEHLQPIGFERKDLPGNRYEGSVEIGHDIVTKTYAYPLVASRPAGPMNDVVFTRPSDTELAARLVQDYMIDRTLTVHQELKQDLEVADILRDQFQSNGWNPLTLNHPDNPELTITITPSTYAPQATKESDIDYFMTDSPDAMLYGDEHLLNVAHTYLHLPEAVQQQKQSEKDLDEFFHEHIEGYTKEQHKLISDIWTVEFEKEHELGLSGMEREERDAKLAEVVPKEMKLPTEVYKAAKELGEDRSTYSDWHKDVYGHRPHSDAEWGISPEETKPFAGIKREDYRKAFEAEQATQQKPKGLQPGEYEVGKSKDGSPLIHGKPDFEGAPKDVYFKPTFGIHTFSDPEVKSLLQGEKISVPTRSGSGKVELGACKINDHEYFGVRFADTLQKGRRLPDAPETNQSQNELQAE